MHIGNANAAQSNIATSLPTLKHWRHGRQGCLLGLGLRMKVGAGSSAHQSLHSLPRPASKGNVHQVLNHSVFPNTLPVAPPLAPHATA